MIVHLLHIVGSLLALSLAFGLLAAILNSASGGKITPRLCWATVLGLVVGLTLYQLLRGNSSDQVTVQTLLLAAIMLLMVLVLGTCALRQPGNPGGTWPQTIGAVLIFLLGVQGSLKFLALNAAQTLTSTSVLNTELILNVAALLSGVALLILVTLQTLHLGRALGQRSLTWFLALVLLPLLVVLSGEFTLGLLKLNLLELTQTRLSYVAKITKASEFSVYAEMGLFAALALVFFCRRRRTEAAVLATMESAARRKVQSQERREQRWFRSSATVALGLFGALLFHDLVASRPPALSPAEMVSAGAQGTVVIPIAAVRDGQLHRYAFITDDGHEVRFFLINKYQDQVKIGVVFDACMICGDTGYIQEGHQVICAACNVRIFIPSVGRPGGCNPIPLPHEVQADSIVIAASELNRGARYFSRIVELEVIDPVTGAKLINLQAPFQYEFKGRTFFFESEQSYQRFRDDPETFSETPDVSKET